MRARTSPRRRADILRASCAVFAIIGAPDGASAPRGIEIDRAWCRETPRGASVGACYVSIRNAGAFADRLLSASASIASRIEMHETGSAAGVMTMRPLPHGVEVPAGAVVDFRERGYHIMLLDLKAPLEAGARIEGALAFERAGPVPVEYRIEPLRAPRGHSRRESD
jgi:hypothetical protein